MSRQITNHRDSEAQRRSGLCVSVPLSFVIVASARQG
jgi:hypothetical protein